MVRSPAALASLVSINSCSLCSGSVLRSSCSSWKASVICLNARSFCFGQYKSDTISPLLLSYECSPSTDSLQFGFQPCVLST